MPKLLLKLFSSQPDATRVDPVHLISELWTDTKLHGGDEINVMIDHIVEKVWGYYDNDNSGALDLAETKNFMYHVLSQHQAILANILNVSPKEITDE